MTPATGIPIDNNNRQYKDNSKNLSFSSLNHEETKELELCVNKKLPLSYDFKYLQPLLDEALERVSRE